jgi:uncharacterized protein (TIGR02599 family)
MDFRGKAAFLNGFTILELLVATTVLSLILVVMLSLITQTSNVWRSSSARIEAFQSARRGFEALTRSLEQATLNTYWDYDNPNDPKAYRRKSELHFLVADAGTDGLPGTPGTGQAIFFQAPANKTASTNYANYDGLTGLINACGFFVQYGSDADWLPKPHVGPGQARERFRLMQWMQATESLTVYEGATNHAWVTAAAADVVPVSDNVIALVIWPKEEGEEANPILNSYSYDSRLNATNAPQPATAHQLPPLLKVALVAIDETSAVRLGANLQPTVAACMSGLFDTSPAKDSPDDKKSLADDLATLEARLTTKSISYRTFVTSVPMREAKWSP